MLLPMRKLAIAGILVSVGLLLTACAGPAVVGKSAVVAPERAEPPPPPPPTGDNGQEAPPGEAPSAPRGGAY